MYHFNAMKCQISVFSTNIISKNVFLRIEKQSFFMLRIGNKNITTSFKFVILVRIYLLLHIFYKYIKRYKHRYFSKAW